MLRKLRNLVKYLKHEAWRRAFSDKMRHLPTGKIYVSFTFDCEEDLDFDNPSYLSSIAFYNSYKYVTSGALSKLVDGLKERQVTGTFYIAYNVAKDIPEVLKYLEENKQAMGVHVHPHYFEDVTYPYNSLNVGEDSDRITSCRFTEKTKWLSLAKEQTESVVGHDVPLFRSGHLACDNETERAAKVPDHRDG